MLLELQGRSQLFQLTALFHLKVPLAAHMLGTPGIVVIARVSLTNFIYVAVLGCNQSGKLAASGELLYAAWKSMPVFRTGTN